MRPALALPLIAAIAMPAAAQPTYPVKIPAPGGEVVIPSARHQASYDEFHYAPARRIGDVIYVSGVIVGPAPDEGTDAAAFEQQVRRAFRQLDATLKAAGASFDDVAMINSFHVWEGPNAPMPRGDQITIINKVKAEYVKGPHPAWTAVGTTGLLSPRGVVEIQLIAYAPKGG
ncbi:RidA family protein [Caulobacter mirabilis]|uniref:RidA family protein n=1 Tax=Caulobacter mirabilis TaxID=69666 RepID=A0A2D2AW91_9CAUL|nr:RidA family protein [Caulobacter mirabilis]ATQ42282.1 hypothetical protein CSW64_07545 [Caulobacter mirabilis]